MTIGLRTVMEIFGVFAIIGFVGVCLSSDVTEQTPFVTEKTQNSRNATTLVRVPIANMTETQRNKTVTIKFKGNRNFTAAQLAAIRRKIVEALNRRTTTTTAMTSSTTDVITTTRSLDTTSQPETTSTSDPLTSTESTTTTVTPSTTTHCSPHCRRRRRRDGSSTNPGSGSGEDDQRVYTDEDISLAEIEPMVKDGIVRVSVFSTLPDDIDLDLLFEAINDELTKEELATVATPVEEVIRGLPNDVETGATSTEPGLWATVSYQFWLPVLLAVLLFILLLLLILCYVRRSRDQGRKQRPTSPPEGIENPIVPSKASRPNYSTPPQSRNGHGPRQLDDNDGYIVPMEEWASINQMEQTRL